MRIKDKEVTDIRIIEQIIMNNSICRIGLCNNNQPYVVPMNFGYKNNCLYIHSTKQGKKIDILKDNPNICFEVEEDKEFVDNA
jgi:nitroimidazol reductase NimA-like FMN-containing flavoprotein (pyridoxamine 5'-phosphate oxidase superfamily)